MVHACCHLNITGRVKDFISPFASLIEVTHHQFKKLVQALFLSCHALP